MIRSLLSGGSALSLSKSTLVRFLHQSLQPTLLRVKNATPQQKERFSSHDRECECPLHAVADGRLGHLFAVTTVSCPAA